MDRSTQFPGALPPKAIVDGAEPVPPVIGQQDVVSRRAESYPSRGSAGASGLVEGVSSSALSRLPSETIRIQEEERRKLSLDLHDDIAQVMGNLVLMMDACLAVAPKEAAELRQYLLEARETARQGFHRVKNYSIDLRPPMLDDLGLVPTIHWYAERFAEENGMHAEVSMPDRMPPLDGERETACFRIIQQALQNIRQHARATRVDIVVESRPGWLRIAVIDDGIGIDQRELDQKLAEGTHIGLAGMRFRAGLLGGTLDFVSAAGEGAKVVAEIPLGTTAGPL